MPSERALASLLGSNISAGITPKNVNLSSKNELDDVERDVLVLGRHLQKVCHESWEFILRVLTCLRYTHDITNAGEWAKLKRRGLFSGTFTW